MVNRHAYMCRQNICTVKIEIENFKRDREKDGYSFKTHEKKMMGTCGTERSPSLLRTEKRMCELVI